jgi:hypothetical protein
VVADAEVHRDPQQPGAEAADLLESVDVADGAEERLLRQVGRVVRMPDHAQTHVVDAAVMRLEKLAQRPAVTALDTLHELPLSPRIVGLGIGHEPILHVC